MGKFTDTAGCKINPEGRSSNTLLLVSSSLQLPGASGGRGERGGSSGAILITDTITEVHIADHGLISAKSRDGASYSTLSEFGDNFTAISRIY